MTAFPKSILTILTLTKMTTDCKMIKSHFFGEEIGAKIPTFFSLKTTQTMKTNIINHTVQTITSLEIAELTGKQHFHLMRDIRKMEIAWEKVTQSKFGCSTYKDATGRTLPCYVLTKTECLYIATKFNDEARAKLVLRDMGIQ